MASPAQIREALIAIFDKLGGDSKKLVGPSPSKKPSTVTEQTRASEAIPRAIDKKQATDTIDRTTDPNFIAEGFDVNELATPRVTRERAAAQTEAKATEKMRTEAPAKDAKAESTGVFDEPERKLTQPLKDDAAAIESFDKLPRPLPKDAGPYTHFQELENWDKFMEGSGSITKLRTKGRKGSKDPKNITTSDDIIEINERRDAALRKQIEQVKGTKNREVPLGNTTSGRANVKSLAKDVVEADVADSAVIRAFGPDLEQVPGKVKLSPEGVKGTSELDNLSLRQLEDIFGGPDNPTTAGLRKELSKAAQRSGRTRGPDQPELKIPTKKKTFMNRFHPDSSKLGPVQEKITGPLDPDTKLTIDKARQSRILQQLENRLQRELKKPQSPVGREGPEQILNQQQLLEQIIRQMARGE